VNHNRNSIWSKTAIGMATVTKVGNRLAIFYDLNHSNYHQHMGRDIGLAWLDLPLSPEKVKRLALPPNEDDNDIADDLPASLVANVPKPVLNHHKPTSYHDI